MSRIGLRFNQALGDPEAQLFLHTLSSEPHRRRDLRSSPWFSRQGDRTQHLPTH